MLRLLICVWVLGTLMACPMVGHAVTTPQLDHRESLRGLSGVAVIVIVEDFSNDAKRAGLTEAQIKTDVELRLRQAGIKVMVRLERLLMPGKPFLHVRIAVMRSATAQYSEAVANAFTVQVTLSEFVNSPRNRLKVFSAITWEGSMKLVLVSSHRLARMARDVIRDRIDEFINDYLAVNLNPEVAKRASPIPSSHALILRAQEHLRALGYKPGPVDGILGNRTHQALRQYQTAKELPVTGDLNDETKMAMGVH